ncbi:hypothetical protein TELCIR_25617, partial [Teladorsagia circumcincta]
QLQSAFIKANRKLEGKNVDGEEEQRIDVGTNQDCTMDMALKDKKCTALVGDIEYNAGSDTYKNLWLRINKVHGTILVNQLEENNLEFLRNVTVEGWACENYAGSKVIASVKDVHFSSSSEDR